ncbi:SPARC-related modular calcium-binding protein 1 isoform X3 [Paramormyrops kingsleyae]|uniref:SPARC-related modular calcium-binding protein 1 isoform X3 n=1 Tax=Paramormyrops kingsleyae TaxID=1676925 RepID=UPI003B97BD59
MPSITFLRNSVFFLFPCFFALLLLCLLPRISGQKSTGPRWLIGDRESHCGVCTRTQGRPVCGSDGRSYETSCDLQKAKCKDRSLAIAHRGRCKGKNWARTDQPLPGFGPTSSSETKDTEIRDIGQLRCKAERNQALDHPKEFIPECNEDGSFAQVQCHTLTGYCWCVTPDGKPVSGSSVHNRTPVCSGNFREFMGTHAGTSGLSGSATDKTPGPPSSGRKVSFRFFLTLNPDDGSKPTPTMETHVVSDGDEITAPTLWIKQLDYKENKQNSSSFRRSEKVPSCDQERQSALDEDHQNSRQAIFIPDCGPGGLYKPVQCHQSTGYCWCVMVDTGRPIPGTSTRYQMPDCDSGARSRASETDDPFRDRDLQGCPEAKKVEFITTLLDALTTDMVQAVNSPTPSGGGRFAEPDPTHTLEERVVHWYFAQLDNNASSDINKKELKPFRRYVKKKAKPKKCARKFIDYCDLNNDKAISLLELKGCLGVSKDGGSSVSSIGQGTSTASGVKRHGSWR